MSPRRKTKEKPKIHFTVSRKKLSLALQKLNQPPDSSLCEGRYSFCNSSIVKQLNTAAHVQPVGWKQNWLELFQASVTRHDWDTFIRTLRLASQSHAHCGLNTVLRNAFFGILTHPTFKDPKTLKMLLYAVAPCRSEDDIEFCIETILRTFNGEVCEHPLGSSQLTTKKEHTDQQDESEI